MKALMIPSLSIIFVGILLTAACQPARTNNASEVMSSESFKPLAKRNEHSSVCGVSGYTQKSDASCGANYPEGRYSHCRPELYRNIADSRCPGSVSRHDYERSTSGNCNSEAREPDACDPGHIEVDYKRKTTTCVIRDPGRFPDRSILRDTLTVVVGRTRSCRRNAVAATCRLAVPTNVERYSICRSLTPSGFRTCDDPTKPIYKKCEFYKTKEEARAYVDQVKSHRPQATELLISSKANFLSESDEEAQLSCHIAKFENDPLFESQMRELKIIYVGRFGREHKSDRFDCHAPQTGASIETTVCEDSDESRKCQHVRRYRANRKWIDVKLLDLKNLETDIPAQKDATLKRDIANEITELSKY